MALIICPDCKKEISDRAKTCIFCGCPIEQLKNEVIEDAKVEVPSTETFIGESETDFSEDSVLFLVNNYYVDMAKMTAAYPDPNELADHLLKNTRCVRKTAVKIMEDYTNGNYNHNKRIAKKYKDLKKNRWEKPKRQGHPFKKYKFLLYLIFLFYNLDI